MLFSRRSLSCNTGACQTRAGLPVCPASIILLALLLWSLFSGGCSSVSSVTERADRAEPRVSEPATWPNAHLLVSASELHDEIRNGPVRLVDMRSWGYDEGFIPGAVSIEGAAALTDLDNEIENFMIDARMFAELMGERGIDRDTDLVLYDDGMALGAARLFYALERYGHRGTVRLLNGGFPAWERAGYPVQEHEGLQHEAVVYETNENEGLVCDVAYISSRMGSDDFILFDARAPEEFRGEHVMAERGGHIPGAVNIEWRMALTDTPIPFFRPADELAELFAGYGITPDKEVVPYCHTNTRGAHVYFTLRLMGYDSVRPYEGSWSEYGNLDGVPIN